jgi:hypothetical protein
VDGLFGSGRRFGGGLPRGRLFRLGGRGGGGGSGRRGFRRRLLAAEQNAAHELGDRVLDDAELVLRL